MEYSLFSKKVTGRRKKLIPWHVQKRYLESLSQLSLNQTYDTAFYKRRIKSLQRNNKHLALALEQNRHLVTDKENLLIDNGKMLDIINFSRLKLMDVASNMKQAAECLNETLGLLNTSINDSLSKSSPKNLNYRNNFKSKLEEIEMEPVVEVTEPESENSDRLNKNVKSFTKKGKISRVDGCTSSSNKKCKLEKKNVKVERNYKDMPKSREESMPTESGSKDTNMKNSNKCGTAPVITSENKRESSPKNSNIEYPSSSKLQITRSSLPHQIKNDQESHDKARKDVKVLLTDIAETCISAATEHYRSLNKSGPTSESSINFNFAVHNSPEDRNLIKKCFSSNSDQVLNFSQAPSTSNFPHKVQFADISDNNEKCLTLSSIARHSVCGPTSSVVKMLPIVEDNIAKRNSGSSIKNTDFERDKKSYKSHCSKLANRVQLYYDEESIEKVEGETFVHKNGVRKCINKSKARKTVSNKKKTISPRDTILKSNCVLPDNVSKLGKNSFLVTADIHSPPNRLEMKSKIYVSKTKEPRVVLTDIFQSNRGLLSEMVGNGLHENRCLPKTPANSVEVPMATGVTNDLPTTYMDFDYNAENRCLPEDRESVEYKDRPRRTKILSYKEPKINVKMRRQF